MFIPTLYKTEKLSHGDTDSVLCYQYCAGWGGTIEWMIVSHWTLGIYSSGTFKYILVIWNLKKYKI